MRFNTSSLSCTAAAAAAAVDAAAGACWGCQVSEYFCKQQCADESVADVHQDVPAEVAQLPVVGANSS